MTAQHADESAAAHVDATALGGRDMVARVPDVEPFTAEPLLLSRLNRRDTSTVTVAVMASLAAFVGISWSAALGEDLYRDPNGPGVLADVWLFLTRGTAPSSEGVPFLRDYPSIVLAVTITLSVPLVYGLFRNLQVLHSELDELDCIRYDEDGRKALEQAVEALNSRLAYYGKRAPVVAVITVVSVLGLNLRLQGRLLPFLAPGDQYAGWWAALVPFSAGGAAWVLLGSVGVYMVYVEAVVGVSYVKFLRECQVQYRFRANAYNPDGFYGWARLRRIVSNMEAGVVCSAATVVAMSFFLQPAVGGPLASVALGGFMAVVLYVFVGAMTNLRRQVAADRRQQANEIIVGLPKQSPGGEPAAQLETLVGLARLEMLGKVPSMPIRKGALVAGGLSLVAPLAAIVGQSAKFVLP